jgi:hypothetical protein
MTAETQDLIYALDPVAWCRQELNFSPDPWQADVLMSSHPRILLNCARQAGKSTVSALLGVHRAIYYPESLILMVAPSERQSGELFRISMGFLSQLPDPPKLEEDNKTSCQLKNASRLVSVPGSEKTIRGFSGVDLLIVDEAARVLDETFTAISLMIATSGGRLIYMSTPAGKRGRFYQEWVDGGLDWFRFEIPASECKRITPLFLEQEMRSLGTFSFEQEFFCKFHEAEDSVFRLSDLLAAFTDDIEPLYPMPGELLPDIIGGA